MSDDILERIRQTQDTHIHSTWGGSVYALENVLSFVNNNDDIAISSKAVIKNYLEQEIKRYKDLQGSTDIGKTMNKIQGLK
tara:strand:- start:68 stop:310 length:243 start_codon:yes stop_codon:yes gene_type:complete